MNPNATVSYMAVQVERGGLDRRAARACLVAEAAGEQRSQRAGRRPQAARRWLASLVSNGRTRSSRPSAAATVPDHAPTPAS